MPLPSAPMPAPATIPEMPDFSMVPGGPLFQLFRRAYLTGDGLELMVRRILVITGIVWLPLLVLSLADGSAFGGSVKISFLHDVESHVRFLAALPMLIFAELDPAAQAAVRRKIPCHASC